MSGGRSRGPRLAASGAAALADVCRLREESATRSSDRLPLPVGVEPPPTTLEDVGREYGVSWRRDVQLKALRGGAAGREESAVVRE